MQREVLLRSRQVHDVSAVLLKRRNLVANGFLDAGRGLPDDAPHALEHRLHSLGLCGYVLVNGLVVGLGHRVNCAIEWSVIEPTIHYPRRTARSLSPCGRGRGPKG